MHPFQGYKRKRVIDPVTLDNATATSYVVDMLGAKECHFVLSIGATDVAFTALKVQESDTLTDATTLATPSDVTGLVVGTSVDPVDGTTSVLPSATDDGGALCFTVENLGRKRYLQLVAVAGNGTTGTAMSCQAFILPEEGPTTASQRGYLEHLTV